MMTKTECWGINFYTKVPIRYLIKFKEKSNEEAYFGTLEYIFQADFNSKDKFTYISEVCP